MSSLRDLTFPSASISNTISTSGNGSSSRKVYEVRFNYDWEYSNGCTLEYAIAARKGIPRLDHEGSALNLENALERVGAALKELRKDGFAVKKLEHNLALIEAIQS